MADDEALPASEPQRSGPATPNRGKRREPHMIDGTAEDIGSASETVVGAEAPAEASATAEDATVHEPAMAALAADLAAPAEPPPSTEVPPAITETESPRPDLHHGSREAAPPSPGPDPTAPARRSRVPALLAFIGVLLAVLLGAILYTLYFPPNADSIADVTTETAALKQRLTALEAKPAPTTDLAPLQNRVASLEAAATRLKAELDDTQVKVDKLSAAAALSPAPAAAPPGAGAIVVAPAQPAPPGQAKAPAEAAAPAQGTAPAQTPAAEAAAAAQPTAPAQPNPPVETTAAQAQTAAPAQPIAPAQTAAPTPAAAPAPAPAPAQAAAAAPDLGPLQAKVAELDHGLTALGDTVAALPKIDLAPVEAKVADLGQKVTSVQAATTALAATVTALPHVDPAAIDGKIDALDGRLTPIEAELSPAKDTQQVTEARQEGSAAETRAAPLAVTAQAAIQAIVTGKPLETETRALQALGVDPGKVGALQPVAVKGASTDADLIAGFDDVKDRMIVASAPKPTGTVLDRMLAGANSLVKVRPAGAQPGSDTDAIASRIEAALKAGDLRGALTEWTSLPADAKAPSQAWADSLKSRIDAESAARSIAADAISAIAPAK